MKTTVTVKDKSGKRIGEIFLPAWRDFDSKTGEFTGPLMVTYDVYDGDRKLNDVGPFMHVLEGAGSLNPVIESIAESRNSILADEAKPTAWGIPIEYIAETFNKSVKAQRDLN
ncbi:MAG: hypothetical protein HUU10_04370 [Bacteroidetes bacterium]|nr:hypothetical protein [Bacteroidota bacterium]